MKLINSHDKFFKEVFSKKEDAKEFIEKTLSSEIVKGLDLSTLENDNTEYVDAKLKSSFSDVVYNCKYKGENDIKIALLFEHKSYPERYVHFQLLRYMQSIWDTQLKQEQKLTPVFPIVFYHGRQKWTKKNFKDYFDEVDDKIKDLLPCFDYELVDISTLSDEEIFNLYKNIELRTSILLLKNIFDKHFVSKLTVIFADVDQLLNNEFGERFIETTTAYIFFNNIDVNFQKIIEKMRTVSPKAGNKFVSIASFLRKEGRREGRREGRKEGRREGRREGLREGRKEERREVARNLIELGMDNEMIIRVTNLSEEEIIKLRKNK